MLIQEKKVRLTTSESFKKFSTSSQIPHSEKCIMPRMGLRTDISLHTKKFDGVPYLRIIGTYNF